MKGHIKRDIIKLTAFNNYRSGKKEFKYLIGYTDATKVRILCIFLPKMTAHRKDFDENKFVSFLIKN